MFRSSPQAGKKSLGSMRSVKRTQLFVLLTPTCLQERWHCFLPLCPCCMLALSILKSAVSTALCLPRALCSRLASSVLPQCSQLPWRGALFRTIWLMNLGPCSFLLLSPAASNKVVIPKGFCKPQFSPKTTLITDSSEVVTPILPQGNKINQNLLLIL